MKIIDKIKHLLLAFGVILIYMVGSNVGLELRQKPLVMSYKSDFASDAGIQNYKIYEDNLIIWDQSNIFFYDIEGSLIDQVFANGFFTDVYFTDEDILVLDRQFNVLYTYSPMGELEEKIDLQGPVFGLFNTKDGTYIHYKEEDGLKESLVKLEEEESSYETNKFIVAFEKNGRNSYVSELTSENYAYRASVLIKQGRNEYRYNFDNETVFDTKRIGSSYLAITNKNLYRLKQGDQSKVAIEDFRDYFFEDDKITVLTGDRLTTYNSRLDEIESFALDINPIGVFKTQGGYFAYGPTDMIGFIGQDRQFIKKFNQLIHGANSFGDKICVVHRQSAQVFDLVEGDDENLDEY